MADFQYDGHHITGKALKVNVSIANTRWQKFSSIFITLETKQICRLFIGNIPKSKSKDEILEEFRKHAGKRIGQITELYHTTLNISCLFIRF